MPKVKKRNEKGNGGGFRLTRLEEYEGAVTADGIAEVETSFLPEGVRGARVKHGGKEAIFLSEAENGSRAARLETLSHERCHLGQNSLYWLGSPKEEIDQVERKAAIASYRELLPLPYVIDAIFNRRMSLGEIALEEEVTEGFVSEAIAWYSVFWEFIEAREGSEIAESV